MKPTAGLPDKSERTRALDPGCSFIVQAPAGSGKTELLIQRFLCLLARVEQPEEVLAVTFTRKAAGEMRSRVIAALLQAEQGTPPAEPHLRRSYELARDIVREEKRAAWQLHRHPARLNIGTIDSVNAWLAGRTPLTSGGSGLRRVTDAPEPLYREAARATLAMLGDDGDAGNAVAELLRHLDSNTRSFEDLVVAMLPRRDQWLRQVLTAEPDRERMEQPLRYLAATRLHQAAQCIEPEIEAELVDLVGFAARELSLQGKATSLAEWTALQRFPGPEPENLSLWQSLADLLLTQKGTWRESVDKRQGFPTQAPQEKMRMKALLEDCTQHREALREHLAALRKLPGVRYRDEQWAILQPLLEVLRLAAAQLQLAFAERGEADFADVAASALRALGGAGEPSELGLALDYRIRHVLVDEFQDTSWLQYELLRRLTEGWEPGDGRTIFAVGDPMQSIYRFREADVGIFMRVRDAGIGDVRPEFLQLSANFRAAPAVVNWTNQVFATTFPAHDDALLGAVRFAASVPARSNAAQEDGRVSLHVMPAGDEKAEDRQVLALVREARDRAPDERVCILVRSRSHAGRILAALRTAGIEFVAPDLENMEAASVAQDLLAVTRALQHPADRLAWIGVLRAPWCGLSLADLHALLGCDREQPVSQALADTRLRAGLSAEGAAAVERVAGVLERVGAARGRRSLRDLVEGAWLDLAGPATIRERGELETAEAFLQLLEAHDEGGDCPDVVQLGLEMGRRKGSLGSGEPGVQVMTMHKAKGLEFDTVILPGLGRSPRGDQKALLLWQDVPIGHQQSAAVLAPMEATGSDKDPLYAYLKHLEDQKDEAEAIRLLYVACTRAKKNLYLCAQVAARQGDGHAGIEIVEPHRGSLLARLWPAVEREVLEQAGGFPPGPGERKKENVWVQLHVRRFRQDFRASRAPPALRFRGSAQPEVAADSPEYAWAGSWTKHAGSVVHRWLQLIAEEGLDRFDESRLRGLGPRFRRQLEQLGTAVADLDRATERVLTALCRAIADPQGRWILGSDHAAADCELALVVTEEGRFRQVVVDRTFIAGDGNRWVIDYKTSTHEGGDLAAFLAAEAERHAGQLRRYHDVLASLGPEPIRTALYYPLLAELREVTLCP